MPTLVNYERVVSEMTSVGMRSLYYNSGAFGPIDAAAQRYVGWVGPADASIRPEAMMRTRAVQPPYEARLSDLAIDVWKNLLPGPLWIMPKSHWAFELDFGSKSWMPGALAKVGIDAATLAPLTNAPAIEFAENEVELAQGFLTALLENLFGSDFALAFPGRPVVCTVHHHKQLWWVTTDARVIERLEQWQAPELFVKPAGP